MSERDVASELVSHLPGLERLWAVTRGRPEVVIAVLDGPVDAASVADPDHLALSGAVEHGTHVHSIIAGSADGLVPGLAPGCTTLSIPIFAPTAQSRQQICTQEELAAGIHTALGRKANIINISASQQTDLLTLSHELSSALQTAAGADALVVAAAGNQGCACDTIPASVAGVLAVGAHNDAGSPLLSSNWGPGQRTQGVIAPGSRVPGACVGGGLCRATGTSFATATVSGIAGLLMSMDVERGAKPSGRRVRKVLLQSCAAAAPDHVEMASTHLSGRLDVSRALDLMQRASASLSNGEGKVTMSSPSEADLVQPRAQASTPAGTTVIADATRDAKGGLVPADCGCGCGGHAGAGECSCGGSGANAPKKTQLVYAIGRLGVSFVSQARRDSIWRLVNGKAEGDLKPITDQSLRELFEKQPFQAQSVVWTLSRSEVPMYVIVPAGAFAAETYKWMVEEWADRAVEFVSIPGVLAGQVALYDGQIVDAVIPDLRGMYSWETDKYVRALRDARRRVEANTGDDKLDREMKRFLGKIYFSIRNRGASPEERALNAAATNAFNFIDAILEAGADGMTLRDVSVERSPLNRPGSEYFDVLLTFFDPNDRQGRAPLRTRFTIDVSDTVPVMIGDPVTWNEW